MSLAPPLIRWLALALIVTLGACRARTPPPAPLADWQSGPGVPAEHAALLVLDTDGMAKLLCLPGHAQARELFPGTALWRILDVAWQGGPMVAGWSAHATDRDDNSDDQLLLLTPNADPRTLARRVRVTRFSPDGNALAYEVSPLGDNPAALDAPTTYVLNLTIGKATQLGALADPLWDGDGRHLRATYVRNTSQRGRGSTASPWTSLRAFWDRESGAVDTVGPGSAQIPAPAGVGIAWSDEQRSSVAPSQCRVFLVPQGGARHSVVGKFCMGVADDRAVRWSSDGRWLAFPHPGPVPGQQNPGGFFVDVVGIPGGRFPALSALQDRARPEQLAIAVAPGSMWFDWSPSGRFLAMHDGASDLRVYDFDGQGISVLGKGQRPMWSPGGAYLLIFSAGAASEPNDTPPRWNARASARETFALSGIAPGARIALGKLRDARWLPAMACPE